ncbi:MAG: cytidylate kinase family protein [Candidatus Bathyarchaeia archaeon]
MSEKRRKLIICISGMTGCGKSTVAKKLAEKYGLKYYSGGDALKALAVQAGYNPSKMGWWETEEGMRFLNERMQNPSFDRKVDEKLLEWAKEGGVVLDSWTMPWLLKLKSFKIWLEASEEVRAKRLAGRDGLTIDEALKTLKEKDGKTKAIYKKLYGFLLGEDLSPFDMILDVNKLSSEEVFQTISLVIDKIFTEGNRLFPCGS